MEQIRVELSPPGVDGDRASLLVVRGETDITDQILNTNLISLRSYLPPANRQYISVGRQRYTSVASYLRNGANRYGGQPDALPLAVLADAIRSYVTELAADVIVSETESQDAIVAQLAAGEPSFLTLGGRMYRLQATEHSDAGLKLLKKAREQAAAAVRAHRDAAIARVNAECAVQRSQLERERLQLATERAEFARGGQCVIPRWLRQMKVVGGDDGWLWVEQRFNYLVTKWIIPDYNIPAVGRVRERHVSLEWDALVPARPTVDVIRYWLRVNPALGTYDVSHSYIDSECPQLPHAGHNSFCVQPDGMPARCTSLDDVRGITAKIARAFKVVNLSSLLNSVDYEAPTRQYCPPGIRAYRQGNLEGPVHQAPGVRIVERDRPVEIWQAADLSPVPQEAGTTAAAWAAAGQSAANTGFVIELPAEVEEEEVVDNG